MSGESKPNDWPSSKFRPKKSRLKWAAFFWRCIGDNFLSSRETAPETKYVIFQGANIAPRFNSRWFLARLRAVETALTHGASDYLCAGRFTAADVAVGYALLLAQHLGLSAQFGPATQAYWQRLQQRPGYQRAMAVQVRAAEEQGVSTTPAPDMQP